uniref:UBA domain-containing protein n=1 Tax=Anopheles christyi TaxID=43041 RepID=A0A182K093_9DIPT
MTSGVQQASQHLQPNVAGRTAGQINGASSMGNLANHTAGALHLSRSTENLPSLATCQQQPPPPPVPKHQNIVVASQEHHTATCPCSSAQQQQQQSSATNAAAGDPFATADGASDKVIVGPAETIVGIIDTRPPEARHPIILKVDEKADQSLILTAALTPNNVYQYKPTASAPVSTTSLNGFVTVQTAIGSEQSAGSASSVESTITTTTTTTSTTTAVQYKPAPAQPQPTPQRQPQPQPRTQFTQPNNAPSVPSSSAGTASNNHQRHQSLPANSAAVGAKILPHPPSKSITSSQLAASAGGVSRSIASGAGHPLLYENVNLASSGPVLKDCSSQRHQGGVSSTSSNNNHLASFSGAGAAGPSLSSALNNNNNPNVPYENINLEYIARLMQEGYSKENVITALGISRNNIEMACDILHEFVSKSGGEPNLFCRWSIQYGSNWKAIEGHAEGQSCCSTARIEQRSDFCAPIDLHLASRGLQGWPKLHVEVYAVNALQQYWPVGYGFAFVPVCPGQHQVRIATWKVSSARVADTVREKFHTGGFSLAKSDIAFTGIERYKLLTKTAGTVELELMLMFKNFAEYGINVCDINCCCDIDCNAAILRTFDCDQEVLHTEEYHHGEGLQSCRVQGGLFCLVEPVYEEGDDSFYNPGKLSVATRYKWKEVFASEGSSASEEPVRSNHYHVDDAIYFYNETSEVVQPFAIPYSLTGGACQVEQPVQFLRDGINLCRRTVDELSDFNRAFLRHVSTPTRFFQTPKKSTVMEHYCMEDGDCLNATVSICYHYSPNSWNCSVNVTSSMEDTIEEDPDSVCLEMEIIFLHNYTNLLDVHLKLLCKLYPERSADGGNGWMETVWQRISVKFAVPTTPSKPYTNRAVSGNIGYLVGKPLIVSHLEFANNGTTPAGEENPPENPPNRMLAYFTNETRLPDTFFRLRIPISRRNRCTLTEDDHKTVNFGTDLFHRCNYIPTELVNQTAGSAQNYTKFCQDLQAGLYAHMLNGIYPEVYPSKGEGYDKLNLYLSKYGNPVNRTAEWVRVRSSNVIADAEPGSESSPTANTTDTTESYFTCTNMLINVIYQFFYARTRVRDVRHQAVVHDAEIVFGPRVNLRFRLDEEIRVPIFIQVQFFDLTSSSVGGMELSVLLVGFSIIFTFLI